MALTSIRSNLANGVQRLTLARPERRNALDERLVAELHAELELTAADPSVRIILIDAEGPDFCAGADLDETLAQLDQQGPVENLANARRLGDLLIAIRRLDKVVIGAVRGRALAGGAGLANACDIVLAADDARFGYPEVHHGLVPAMVGAILRRSVGEKIAFELLARGDPIDAAEAARLGLVTRVFPAAEMDQRVERYVTEMAARSTSALTLIKRLFYGQDGLSFEEAIGRGAEVNVLARGTADARAGITRFLDRRRR